MKKEIFIAASHWFCLLFLTVPVNGRRDIQSIVGKPNRRIRATILKADKVKINIILDKHWYKQKHWIHTTICLVSQKTVQNLLKSKAGTERWYRRFTWRRCIFDASCLPEPEKADFLHLKFFFNFEENEWIIIHIMLSLFLFSLSLSRMLHQEH